jgi:hypothetical protein
MSERDRTLIEQMRQNGLRSDTLHVAMHCDEQCWGSSAARTLSALPFECNELG